MSKGTFLKSDYNVNYPNRLEANNLSSKKFSDTNFFSNFGTMFSVSSSSAAGITESVITPGIRFFKIGITAISVMKSLENSINTIKNKVCTVNKITNALISGHEFSEIRETLIKLSTKN